MAQPRSNSAWRTRNIALLLAAAALGIIGVKGMTGEESDQPGPNVGGSGPTVSNPSNASTPSSGSSDPTGAITYSPDLNNLADPGEVVWTWVAYEDDPTQGKDRPVLIIGRQGEDVLGLIMTSRDRAASGSIVYEGDRAYYDLGSGPWDSKGRPSEVRLDLVLVLEPGDIRREGAILERERFDAVIDAVKAVKDW